MGCDGGTIPTRDELVKTKKKPEQKDKDSERLYRWQHCALTQEPLEKPVVGCELGRLYNKEAIIEKLLNAKSEGSSQSSSNAAAAADHIKSLKDVRELELEPNPAFKGPKASVGDGYIDSSIAHWICPLTSQAMNGRFAFVFDWSNGKVMSYKAHKMLREDKAAAISEENLITINPEEGSREEDALKTKMDARRARVKAAKKAAKEEKRKADQAAAGPSEPKKVRIVEPKKSTKSSSSSNGIEKKMQQQQQAVSVQKDPSKSEVYKSLFSSHSTAINKPKGNWVTFDPRYN